MLSSLPLNRRITAAFAAVLLAAAGLLLATRRGRPTCCPSAGSPASRPERARRLTVTGTGATANHTFLAVFPTTYNGTSSVNLTKGAIQAGLAISGIGADGKVRILNYSGATNVIVDLAGWYLTDASGAR